MSDFAPWLPNDDKLIPFYMGVQSFTDGALPKSKESLNRLKNIREKSIVDPVQGYIHMNPWEVALLDTQLFQRLRHIRQLGLAYQVFPTLGYSRFEHSIGVLGRIEEVLNKLIENQTRLNDGDSKIADVITEFKIPIRLAALCHDMGHCLFSHASERVIKELPGHARYPSGKYIQDKFTEHFEKDKPISFAEIFSITILGMKEIHEPLAKLQILPL